MSQDPIDRYVTRLGHALDLPRALRRRVLRETEAHLRETAAALELDGLAPDEAAKAAVERFGEVGEIARQMEDDRPPRSLPRRSLLVVALAGAFAVAGVAVAVTGSDTPYGLVVSRPHATNGMTQGGASAVVRLDPRTLKPAKGRRVALGSFNVVMSYDPTAKLAAATHQQYDGLVRVVDLAALRRVRDLRVARPPWRLKLIAWSDREHLVAVVQTMTGDYHQNVGQRRLVVFDLRSGRQVASRAYPRRGYAHVLGVVDGRVIILWTPSNPGGRSMQLDQVGADASVKTIALDEGRAPGATRTPAALLDAGHQRVLLVLAGGPIEEVQLGSGDVARHPGVPLTVRSRHWATMEAKVVDEHTLAVSGSDADRTSRRSTSRPVGLMLVDTRTWTHRLIDPHANGVEVVDGVVVANAYPTSSRSGKAWGLSAYSSTGRRLWHRYGSQPVAAGAAGDVLVVGGLFYFGVGGRQLGDPFDNALLDPATGRRVGSLHFPGDAGDTSVYALTPTIPGYR